MLDTAIQLGLPLEGIAEGFMTIAGAARSAGVSTKGAIEIVSLLGVLGERLHISSATLAREARDIFQALPQISRTVLGNYLQLDQAILKSQICVGKTWSSFCWIRLKLVGLVAQQNRNTLMASFIRSRASCSGWEWRLAPASRSNSWVCSMTWSGALRPFGKTRRRCRRSPTVSPRSVAHCGPLPNG